MCAIKMDLILVPTDFSECSKKAFCYAAEMARLFRAEIVLLHVIDIRVADNVYHIHQLSPEMAREEMLQSAQKSADEVLRMPEVGELKIEVRFSEGIPVVEVKAVAEECGADLIVMGTHGATGLNHLLYGSTAQGVVVASPCPVLTVNP